MTKIDYEQRIQVGVSELCNLAQEMMPDDAEEFFQEVMYRASNRFRRISKETQP